MPSRTRTEKETRIWHLESRTMRKEMKPGGSFTGKAMFGEDVLPHKKRLVGNANYSGTSDPLSNFGTRIYESYNPRPGITNTYEKKVRTQTKGKRR